MWRVVLGVPLIAVGVWVMTHARAWWLGFAVFFVGLVVLDWNEDGPRLRRWASRLRRKRHDPEPGE
jgi:hypothetical protein